MLDLKLLRDHPQTVRDGLAKKKFKDVPLDEFYALDEKRRVLISEAETAKAAVNAANKEMAAAPKGTPEFQAKVAEMKTASAKVKDLEKAAAEIEEQWKNVYLTIPNIPHPSVPVGKREEDNVVHATWGDTERDVSAAAKPHWDIPWFKEAVDFERGVKVTGAGFPFYVGDMARLVRALIQFFLEEANDAGYREVWAPLLVNSASATATGQLPDKEGQMYQVPMHDGVLNPTKPEADLEPITAKNTPDFDKLPPEAVAFINAETAELNSKKVTKENTSGGKIYSSEAKDWFFLIPTAEVPVTNFYRDEIIPEEQLPVKFCGYTPCFRREAGSWGAHVRGLNRLHQFDKVELVKWVHPDTSFDELETLRADAERILQKLGLPYRTLFICTGDIGFAHSKQYDLEVWAAGQKRWLEVSSCSNFTDFQARRAGIRYRPKNGGKAETLHTLNGSGLGLPRVLAAILENNLQPDGSVTIPEVLRRWYGKETIGPVLK